MVLAILPRFFDSCLAAAFTVELTSLCGTGVTDAVVVVTLLVTSGTWKKYNYNAKNVSLTFLINSIQCPKIREIFAMNSGEMTHYEGHLTHLQHLYYWQMNDLVKLLLRKTMNLSILLCL